VVRALQESVTRAAGDDAARGIGSGSKLRAGARPTLGPLTTPELRADCANCFALCCVALPFAVSADFAIDKPAGTPCRHLHADFRCGIHDHLNAAGFRGCAVYDCFGAGQRVAQQVYRGRDWRAHPELRAPMFATFTVMRQLHELLWYLHEALGWAPAATLHARLRDAIDRTETLAERPERLTDVGHHRAEVAALLRAASRLVRGDHAEDRSGADLAGADLRGTQLTDTDFRNACLIGVDLRGAALTRVDVLGADLRDADLRGADLRETLFLTQPQLTAARGDATTRISTTLDRPAHWQ
jgi:uncharacterized protein YjbI with pentapeptide repeats